MTNILEAASFGATSTTDDVLSGDNLKGKRILVTGVSAGLGVETSRSLAAHGVQVVGAARDLNKANAATEQVRKDAAANGGSFELVELDLANLKSVRACADQLLAKAELFDVVIANAGVVATSLGKTADGFETQFGTNHLGHFVLVNRITPLLHAGGRLINLSSAGHRYSNVDLDDPNFQRTPYEPFVAYGRSKTANILFAVAFDRRHRDHGVRAAAVHPGTIHTELARHLDPREMEKSSNREIGNSRPRASRRSGGRLFLREPQLRYGSVSLLEPTRSAADIARTAMSGRSYLTACR
jgi:NAD(P)-dependent dehydrogenase (short-subunit alcohol dehydrogenase family)